MRKRKLFAVMLALALALMCLAGCGGTKEPAATDEPPAGGEAPVVKYGMLTFSNIGAGERDAKIAEQTAAAQQGEANPMVLGSVYFTP